ncbi:MAG: TetR family transcriptional regulator [Nocardiopsaceae bacterium]|nr:TetR family transcriptional regulator [Nocardiopsaceae bacterium]
MTRQVIVDAARLKFAERGYEGATLRAIAQEARVDPALIHHFFSSKQGVFAAAIADVLKPAELIPEIVAPGLDGLGERLMRMLINLWESEKLNPLVAVIRSAVSHEEAAELLREFISTEVLGRLGGVLEPPLRDLRTALVGSQIVGLVMARYVVKVEPLASADPETLVAAISPTIQYYLASDISSDPAAVPFRLP